jgi:hypothetical protein
MLKKILFLICILGFPALSFGILDRAVSMQPIATQHRPAPQTIAALNQQVLQLEQAIAPPSPQLAVETWARGVKTRNGALQFAVLSPSMRHAHESAFVAANWVTGGSSPWVDRYRIMSKKQQGETWWFEVEYHLMTSTGSSGTETQQLAVSYFPLTEDRMEGWYIISFTPVPSLPIPST